MYVMVLVLFMNGGFKVASDQMLYTSMDICNVSMQTQLKALNSNKPSPDSYATATCVEMPMPKDIKPSI